MLSVLGRNYIRRGKGKAMVVTLCEEGTYAEVRFECYAEARPENGFIKKQYNQ
jgi:hypothetical protein